MFDELGFRWRAAMRWSLPAWHRRRSLDAIAHELTDDGRRRLAGLRARFDFSRWEACCSPQAWRESLYALDVVDQHLRLELPAGRALDVGAKNGAMLAGLATALPRGWDAVELDAHRRYLWGSTRRVYGEAVAAAFPGCRFIAGDVRSLEGPWAAVTWFLPFLTPAPLEAWGLPARFLAPLELLRHVTSRVAPGGVLLVVNQGEHEASLQGALFEQVGGSLTRLGRIDSPLSPFRLPRFGWRWQP